MHIQLLCRPHTFYLKTAASTPVQEPDHALESNADTSQATESHSDSCRAILVPHSEFCKIPQKILNAFRKQGLRDKFLRTLFRSLLDHSQTLGPKVTICLKPNLCLPFRSFAFHFSSSPCFPLIYIAFRSFALHFARS